MTIKVNARYENGVFVPESPVSLPEHHRLTLTFEGIPAILHQPLQSWDDPNDPMPTGGPAMHDWWDRHRLRIDPAMGEKIAQAKAYGYYEEPDDES